MYWDEWLAPLYAYSYRTLLQALEAQYDVRGSVLAGMIRDCLMNRATRRVYYAEHAAPRGDSLPGTTDRALVVRFERALLAGGVPLLADVIIRLPE